MQLRLPSSTKHIVALVLILCLTACNSTGPFPPAPPSSPESTAVAQVSAATAITTPSASLTRTAPDTATSTAAPSATDAPSATAIITATASLTTTGTPTGASPGTIIMNDYSMIDETALGFDELGTPPPLPVLPKSLVLPTIAPDQLAGVALPPQQVWRADRTQPRIALTFDTGQGTPVVKLILAELQQANVRATFFIVGNWAIKNGDVVRAIVAGKHELGNHSYSHPNLTLLADDQVLAQMVETENIVRQETGCTTRPFFRAPFGATNKHVQQLIGQAGFINFMWSVHGGDWLPGATVESIHQLVVQNTGNGSIIILHSSVLATAEAVPLIIGDLRARGFQFVTLSELLTTDPAHPFRAPCELKT
jgi:peptidoglycan/xylan/chitin deacetylase (PgdA/CDA1 family)